MTPIVNVIPCCAADAALAENLIDTIFALNGKEKRGHALVVTAHDVHAEMATKLLVSAEVAFKTAEVVEESLSVGKSRVTQMFMLAAKTVQERYRVPFLWLEPDCVPVKPDWQERLAVAYNEQPKQFLGSHLKIGNDTVLGKVAIYPPDAIVNYPLPIDGHFWLICGKKIYPKSNRTRLIQHGKLAENDGLGVIREDAVLFHGDKSGRLLDLVLGRILAPPPPPSPPKSKKRTIELVDAI